MECCFVAQEECFRRRRCVLLRCLVGVCSVVSPCDARGPPWGWLEASVLPLRWGLVALRDACGKGDGEEG